MTRQRTAALFLLALIFAPPLFSQDTPPRVTIKAVRLDSPITLDGILTEPVWHRSGYSDFKQKEPNQGEPATERTEVWVAYDEEAIYIAADLHETAPDSIMQVLGRRDAFITADWFVFWVDPYYDRRSGFYFGISAAGTLLDGVLYNDDSDDDSWDGVWEGKVYINGHGWTAEMRIPFSQLRFHQQEQYRWGVNFGRMIGRKNEESYVVYTPRGQSGFVSRFVDLVGMDNVVPPAQVEFLPYVNTRAEYTQAEAGNPFRDGSRYLPGLGGDLKVALGTNLTLDATINPDFGQVEVDPAVVNLSDVETYYPEKRPFFIEGANTFRFGRGGSSTNWSFNWSEPTIFYSRRIGRAPTGSLPGSDYADVPIGTTILSAAKVTGKVNSSVNVGTVHALTAREMADVSLNGSRSRAEVEPLTYYGVARVQQEFNKGHQGLGVMSTYASRFFKDERLRSEMNNNSLFAGLDGWVSLDTNRTWVLTGWGGFSQVWGSKERMVGVQQNSQHYFQRPDAGHVQIDSAATSLGGYAGRLFLVKQKGAVMANAAFGVVSPGFDVNDLGFSWRTDVVNMHVAGGYRWTEPGKLFRRASLTAAFFQNFDFGGNVNWRGVWQSGNLEFHNFWSMFWNYAYNPQTVNNRRTRGGPLMLALPGRQFGLGFSTDSRKQWVFSADAMLYHRTNEPEIMAEVGVEWKPAPSLNVSFSPSFYRDRTRAMWVTAVDDPLATQTYGRRYIFAVLNQTNLAASIRVNWTFTPQLSLQLFLQPLLAAGDYHDFKELRQPKTYNFLEYGKDGSTLTEVRNGEGNVESYDVDPDGAGPAPKFNISNPDFRFSSLRGNAVLRWEYHPGSVLYLVWTQSRSDYENLGEFAFGRSVSRLVNSKADNIFMLKMTYWFSL